MNRLTKLKITFFMRNLVILPPKSINRKLLHLPINILSKGHYTAFIDNKSYLMRFYSQIIRPKLAQFDRE